MKTRNKLTALFLILSGICLSNAALFAQDADFDESMFEDDAGFESFETDSAFGDSFGDTNSSGFGSALSALSFNGNALMEARAYIDRKDTDTEDSPTSVKPEVNLTGKYENTSTEVEFKLNFNKDSIETYKEDVINELTARAYLGNWILEGGKMKVVWGKGLKLHVVDNFNATDYTNFLIPEYIDRRLAEPMLRAIYNSPNGWRMETIYTPTMTGERYAKKGVWVPGQVSSLSSKVKTTALTTVGSTDTSTNPYYTAKLMAASSLNEDSLYPDTNKLKYGQAGIRFTGTLGSFDWGLSYYYGRNKKVSVYAPKTLAYVQDYITNGGSSSKSTGIEYDRLQVFGLEGAKAFGPLNTRFELAYNLTEDTAGDDPEIRNNSISWVPGFDIPLPIHNMTLNVQEIGTYILKNGKIKDNAGKIAPGKNYDVDADSDDCYTNNKIAIAISDTFLHEKLLLDCTILYGFERKDLAVMPKVTYTIKTDLELYGQGLYIRSNDENGEFHSWKNNSFAQIGIKYTF